MSPHWCRPSKLAPGHHGVSAALEFAVQVLRVREIVVMGHGMCGGCKAALTQESMHGTEPGEGGFIADWIEMLDDVARTSGAGIRHRGPRGRAGDGASRGQGQPRQPAHFPLRAANRRQRGKLTLRGAFFAISDGVLHLLDERQRPVQTGLIACHVARPTGI